MTTRRTSSRAAGFLETFPVATAIHLLVALAITIVFVTNGGELPDDTATYAGILLGGNGLFAIGRGRAVANRRGRVTD
jgi:hypothetical protein